MACDGAGTAGAWPFASIAAIEQSVSMDAAMKQELREGRAQSTLTRERRFGIMLPGPAKVTDCFIGILFFAFDRK